MAWCASAWAAGAPGARRPGLVCALVARSGSPPRADRGCARPGEVRLRVDGPEGQRTAEGLAGGDFAGGRKGREKKEVGERDGEGREKVERKEIKK